MTTSSSVAQLLHVEPRAMRASKRVYAMLFREASRRRLRERDRRRCQQTQGPPQYRLPKQSFNWRHLSRHFCIIIPLFRPKFFERKLRSPVMPTTFAFRPKSCQKVQSALVLTSDRSSSMTCVVMLLSPRSLLLQPTARQLKANEDADASRRFSGRCVAAAVTRGRVDHQQCDESASQAGCC